MTKPTQKILEYASYSAIVSAWAVALKEFKDVLPEGQIALDALNVLGDKLAEPVREFLEADENAK